VRAFTERRPKRIGLVAITAIVVVVLAILFFNRSVFTSGYKVTARFTNAAGITKGTEVMVAGVKVGSVTGVSVHGNTVDAALSVERSIQLPHDTDAAVQVETLLGVVDVTLQPVSGWSQPLRNGALITNTSVPTELFQLQRTGQRLLSKSNAKALNSLVESLATITKGKQTQVAEIINGLGALTSTVDQRSGQVSQLIDSANTLSSTLAAKDQELVSIVNNLNTVSTGLADHSSDLSSLITNVDQMASQTNSLVSGDSPALNALLSSLHTDLGVVSAHQEDLAEGVSYLGGALKGFASIADAGGQQVDWANIFVNPAGLTSTYGVIGPCGAFDEALTDALGPDPLSCDDQTGTTPGEGTATSSSSGSTSGSASGTASGSAAGSGSSASSGGTTTTTALGTNSSSGLPIGPNSGLGGLSQLLSPLLGGS
jgi:phospholipid/cholesterol/gamma-HCH transport system substrate-binding protein